MLTNGSPPKIINMAAPGALFGSQQRPEDNVGASDNNAGNTPNKDTQFRQLPNKIQPPQRNSYPPSQPPFPGAPQFSHPAPFNMTPSSQQNSGGAIQGYQSYGPSWQGYDFATVAVVQLKCSPLSNSPDRGRHLQAHIECLQHRLQTMQSTGQHCPPLLHTDNFPAYLGDLQFASQ
jgi:hypothetical protein